MSDDKTYFTELEGIVYSFVEYIPVVGSWYSFSRARQAHREGDTVREIASAVNVIQGAIRDAVLIGQVAEPVPVVVVHAALEGLTDKLADVWATGKVEAASTPDKNKSHILFAGSTRELAEQTKARFTINKNLGIHHFHGSLFEGKLNYDPYAENENLYISLPDGISEKARSDVTWTWTKDADGIEKASATVSSAKMSLLGNNKFKFAPAGNDTNVFGFYYFQGEILDKGNSIRLQMQDPNGKTVATLTVKRKL
ncbi:hypothetical protein VNI00_013194 [Paramarasmius palmivorus]|uniref:Uncharacterized protein n=1 Tax=Paramarasmius palmivorus TaxID=297713 RepID=A0AAW0BZG6_9AGAR